MAYLWRPGLYVRVAILSLVTVLATIGAQRFAPLAWDSWTYSLAYAEGQLVAGVDEAWVRMFLIQQAFRTFLIPVALTFVPVLTGWLISKVGKGTQS